MQDNRRQIFFTMLFLIGAYAIIVTFQHIKTIFDFLFMVGGWVTS